MTGRVIDRAIGRRSDRATCKRAQALEVLEPGPIEELELARGLGRTGKLEKDLDYREIYMEIGRLVEAEAA